MTGSKIQQEVPTARLPGCQASQNGNVNDLNGAPKGFFQLNELLKVTTTRRINFSSIDHVTCAVLAKSPEE